MICSLLQVCKSAFHTFLDFRLRLLAESKGFRLDDTGLYPATHGSPGKRVNYFGTSSAKIPAFFSLFCGSI